MCDITTLAQAVRLFYCSDVYTDYTVSASAYCHLAPWVLNHRHLAGFDWSRQCVIRAGANGHEGTASSCVNKWTWSASQHCNLGGGGSVRALRHLGGCSAHCWRSVTQAAICDGRILSTPRMNCILYLHHSVGECATGCCQGYLPFLPWRGPLEW